MGDNTAVSISEAARLSGKGRPTIYRHIKQGKLSATIRGDGAKEIQVTELERVYGPLGGDITDNDTTPTLTPSETMLQRETAILRAEIAQLQARVEELKHDKEWLQGLVNGLTQKALPAPPGVLSRIFGRWGQTNKDEDQ